MAGGGGGGAATLCRSVRVLTVVEQAVKLQVNFAICQDFGHEFLAKAKPLRPRLQS